MLLRLKGYHLIPDEEGVPKPSEASSKMAIPLYNIEAVEQFPYLTVDLPDFIYKEYDGLPVLRYGGGYYFIVESDFDALVTLIDGKTINYN